MPREVGTDAFAMQIDMSAVRKGTRARVAGVSRLASRHRSGADVGLDDDIATLPGIKNSAHKLATEVSEKID